MSIIKINRVVATDIYFPKKRSMNCLGYFVMICMAVFSGGASAAYNLVLSDLSSGYSNCSYTDSTETIATFKVTIQYKAAASHLGGYSFGSRGVMIYTYDGNGALQSSSDVATFIRLNNVGYTGVYLGNGYTMYHGNNSSAGDWKNPNPITANISFNVLKSKIAAWPAVAVRAGNYTNMNDVGEVAGVAYIGPNSNGSCTIVVDPELPPPAVTPIVTMTAPDWDLGELSRGEETMLTLPATKDQLCFNYEGSTSIANQKYLINATNTNGLSANGRYLLKSLEDSSQTVPYTLTLANSTDSVLLPNTQNRLFSLDAAGRTCFTPTFKAQPDRAVKGGAYSDILTFTVVAKP